MALLALLDAWIKARMRKITFLVASAFALSGTAASAGKYQTEEIAEQRWACERDALKFCGNEIPNVPRITSCMSKNIKKLSPACRAQFRPTNETMKR